MKHESIGLLAALALLLGLGLAAPARADAKQTPSGRDVFQTYECHECHAVQAEGIAKLPPKEAAKDEQPLEEEEDLFGFDSEEEGEADDESEPPDLSGVGKQHKADWLKKFVTKKIENDQGKRHRKLFKGSAAELDALVAFLVSLETPAAPKPAEEQE